MEPIDCPFGCKSVDEIMSAPETILQTCDKCPNFTFDHSSGIGGCKYTLQEERLS